MQKQMPLVVVLGATACGKSKLAIELAQRFKGEILSADSMQVYKGLDIVTNKVSNDELKLVKHHMIDFVDPLTRFSIVDFRNRSLDIIASLLESNTLPVVVGGTNYYIESLLWKNFILEPALCSAKESFKRASSNHSLGSIDDLDSTSTLIESEAKLLKTLPPDSYHNEDDLNDVDRFFKKPIYNDAFGHVSGDKLWSLLEKVDPRSAHLYHPHDKRRIIRCLQVIQDKKKNFSDVVEEVNKSVGGEKMLLGGPLRFKHTCVLWLSCDNDILDQVLDERVDLMLDRGLVQELEQFHDMYNQHRIINNEKPDYTKGVFQTIGFKEFHDYLVLRPDDKQTDRGAKILRRSIDEMKISTKQYARRQLKWIRRRFTQMDNRDLPPLYKLVTNLDNNDWNTCVRDPAFQIVESLIEDKPLDEAVAGLRQSFVEQTITNKPGKYYCDVCERTFIGSLYIDSHLRSRKHERNLARLRRQTARQESESGTVTQVATVE